MNGRGTRAFTLIELMISLGVLITVLVICSTLFVSLWRRVETTNAIQNVQNAAIMGIDRFARDFEETSALYINIDTYSISKGGTSYLCFPSPRDSDGVFHRYPSGEPEWQTWITYFLYTHSGSDGYYLARISTSWNPMTIPVYPTSGSIGQATTVARGVRLFSVDRLTPVSTDNDTYVVTIATFAVQRNAEYTFSADRTFSFYEQLKR